MTKLRHGHAPGHVRDAFLAAIDAFEAWDWQRGEPEPKIDYQIHYEPREIKISQACGLVWNCTDVLPGDYARYLADFGLQRQTYAAAARTILAAIKDYLGPDEEAA